MGNHNKLNGMAITVSLPPVLVLIIALLAGGADRGRAQTTITGRVQLPPAALAGQTPPRYAHPGVKPAVPEPPTAVVYLEGSFGPATNAPAAAQLWQKDLQFIPTLLPIRTGTVVEFPNADDLYHNVFSYSKPRRFDLGRYRKEDKPASQVFDKPGAIKLFCEIHEHMRATILVLDTPHFTRTDPAGQYRLEKLPAGRYTLKAWLDEKKILEKPVVLEPGQNLTIDFP
jgi:plastocyanin